MFIPTHLTPVALVVLVAVVLVTVALPGCGGGGAGVRPMAGDSRMPPIQPTDQATHPGGIPAAARNRPFAGPVVVQSSNGADDSTSDDITVRVDFRPGGYIDYRVANGEQWFLDLDDPETRTLANRTGNLPATGSTVIGVLATKGSSRHTDDAAALVDDGVSLIMYTDVESETDTDYLVWGSWADVPDDATTHQEIVHGVFASGSAPFRQDDLAPLTGTVRYQGDATGMYFEPTMQPLGGYSFEARVTLEATFGDTGALGAIGGTIDSFRLQTDDDGTRQASPGTMVTLERAAIGGTDSGYFDGVGNGRHDDGTPLAGRWGGRFYGNDESDGYPASIAGTFGAVSDDRGFIGAFGARRQ